MCGASTTPCGCSRSAIEASARRDEARIGHRPPTAGSAHRSSARGCERSRRRSTLSATCRRPRTPGRAVPIRAPRSSTMSHSGASLTRRCDDRLGGLAERRGLNAWKVIGEVVALVHRGDGQDVVTVRGRLGDVEVERHRQVRVVRPPPPVRRRWAPTAPGCPRTDEQRLDLAVAGRGDLLGHQRGRLGADQPAEPADAGPLAPVATAAARAPIARSSPSLARHPQAAEDRAARSIEVSRDEVDRIDQDTSSACRTGPTHVPSRP